MQEVEKIESESGNIIDILSATKCSWSILSSPYPDICPGIYIKVEWNGESYWIENVLPAEAAQKITTLLKALEIL